MSTTLVFVIAGAVTAAFVVMVIGEFTGLLSGVIILVGYEVCCGGVMV